MENRTRNYLIASITGFVCLGIALTSVYLGNVKNVLKPSAADCNHEHVEHYVGHSDMSTGIGYVEHWSCCDCHTAWADENRTFVLGNTQLDRSLLDIQVGMNVEWSARMATPYYDISRGGVIYCDSSFAISNIGDDPYYYTEFVFDNIDKKSAKIYILNESTADILNVDINPWNADVPIGKVVCEKNVWKEVNLNYLQWSSKPNFVIKEPNKTLTSGTIKIALQLFDISEEVISSYPINSTYSGWAEYTNFEHHEKYCKVNIVDLSSIETDGGCIVYNGINQFETRKYSKIYFAIYNPTEHIINNIEAKFVTNDWSTLHIEIINLIPGWNEVYINSDAFELSGIKMLAIYIGNYLDWKANGWKFSQFIGVFSTEETRLSDLAINSDFTGWDAFTEKVTDAEFGEVTVCDFTGVSEFASASPERRFSIVWNGCPVHEQGEYEKYFFAMYNPTENTFEDIQFNVADAGWGTLMSRYHITLKPGWNTISLDHSFFENSSLSMYSINISAEIAVLWDSANWQISNFFGVN